MSATLSCAIAHCAGIAVAAIFAALSLLHVYWALGGTVGLQAAIPERRLTRGDPAHDTTVAKAFQPTVAMTLLVAGGLAAVSALVSLRAGLFAPAKTHWSLQCCLAVIALILIARAVGDLNLVGFFKKTKGTRFATLDSRLYSPLCVVLALGIASIALSTQCRW
jgi:hypothetical protein